MYAMDTVRFGRNRDLNLADAIQHNKHWHINVFQRGFTKLMPDVPLDRPDGHAFLLCADSALPDCHERAGPMLADKHGLYTIMQIGGDHGLLRS